MKPKTIPLALTFAALSLNALAAESADRVVCVKKKTGALRVASKCKKHGELAINFAAIGIVGGEGPRGVQGVPGSQGPAGPPGPKGVNGRQVFVYANGQNIGAYVGLAATSGGNVYSILSEYEYLFEVHIDGSAGVGALPYGELHYTGPNCTGKSYLANYGGSVIVWNNLQPTDSGSVGQGAVFRGGIVDAQGNQQELLYYVPTGASAVAADTVSYYQNTVGSTCVAQANHWSGIFEALPNDPTITGVPNEPLSSPITLGY